MADEDPHLIGQVYGRLAKLWPTKATDLYQRFQRPERALGDWVTHAAFIDQIYDGVAKRWPATFTDVYRGLQRRSGRAVDDWMTLARRTVWARNGGGRRTASPPRKEAGGQLRSDGTTPD